ncbi:MFS transporter [Isachenkonia alkalipeptolytica]|uniref:MFS transporter n=2 Tax=Isachenkonia alkalipeptolytica TaxID=2565777 RepID=A0AA43XL93_9CLOT|nr:MFS transporter [Isachenkonia alkalipeptolytica]
MQEKHTLANRVPFFYGWVIVLVSILGVFFSGPGQTYSVSVFIDSYIDEFGWGRSYVSSFYSLGTLAAGLLISFVGKLVDLKGHRKVMPAVITLFALACFWMIRVSAPWMLLVGFFSIRLLGQGSMTLTSTTLIPQWFYKMRGRALSFMAIGAVGGSFVLPPLNTWIIINYGWRTGWQVWGILLLVIMLPVALVFVKNKPEDIGALPDGEVIDPKASMATNSQQEKSWTLKESMKTRAFWVLMFCVTVPAALNTGVTFHLASIMEYLGFPEANAPMTAALALSVYALSQFFNNFIAGVVGDRFKDHKILSITFLGFIIVLLGFLSIRYFNLASIPIVIILGVLWGGVNGYFAITNNMIWPNYFGRGNLGSIKGFTMMAMVIGSAAGPLPFGFAFDYFGGYTEILLVTAIFPLLALVGAALSPKPDYNQYHG